MAEGDAAAFLGANPALRVIRDPSRFPAPRHGLHRAEVAGGGIHDRDALFDALTDELSFPEWFGRNWDALDDMLSDLSWLGDDDVALLISDAGEMMRAAPRAAAHLLEIWSAAAVTQARRGRALALYLAFEL